jgi:hypothetical protein
MSKDFKSYAYYYIRRKNYDQLLQLCENQLAKKGKDPTTLFWRAIAVGSLGNVHDGMRQLEGLQSRKELQFPITLAMAHFHQLLQVPLRLN